MGCAVLCRGTSTALLQLGTSMPSTLTYWEGTMFHSNKCWGDLAQESDWRECPSLKVRFPPQHLQWSQKQPKTILSLTNILSLTSILSSRPSSDLSQPKGLSIVQCRFPGKVCLLNCKAAKKPKCQSYSTNASTSCISMADKALHRTGII